MAQEATHLLNTEGVLKAIWERLAVQERKTYEWRAEDDGFHGFKNVQKWYKNWNWGWTPMWLLLHDLDLYILVLVTVKQGGF